MFWKVASVVVGIAVIGGAAAALAQVRPAEPAAIPGTYRVTSWPDHGNTNSPYREEVEDHLNRLAAEGWVFSATLAGQKENMMLFERRK